jgi:hypothetical protein
VIPGRHEWNAYPSRESQNFLLRVVGDHTRVESIVRHDPNRYLLRRLRAPDKETFLTDVYILGEADYTLLRTTHPQVDLIILASTWNSCTMDVKEAAMNEGVAIHNFSTLMGGLNKGDDDDFMAHSYSPTDKEGRRLESWP